jgi:CO/xanthine dehydrogenase FAD-binding subunit
VKPAPFEYSRPQSLDEACALLRAEEGARLIAGGQTLVPFMAMRLARPTRLIDIARLRELAYVRDDGETVTIGATTKQCVVAEDALIRSKLPLLAKAMPYIGHRATRARGTIGGSLAHADPAAEIALIAVTLGATLVWRDGDEANETAAGEFFLGPMQTALPATACLTAVRFPVWSERRCGTGFHEINARQSDFAFVSAAAQIAVGPDGAIVRAAVGLGAVAVTPQRLDSVERMLEGTRADDAAVRQALRTELAGIEPMSDLHASGEYRSRVGVTLAARAIADAYRAAVGRA